MTVRTIGGSDIPDAHESLESRDRYARRAEAAEKKIEDVLDAGRLGFATCVSTGDGKGHVRVDFKTVVDAQRFYSALHALSD